MQKKFPEKFNQFEQLRTKERELDLMINKKLMDIQNYQQSIVGGFTQEDPQNTDILRIYIYNTSENQPWQLEAAEQKKVGSGSSGSGKKESEGKPGWTLRIEGRLLGDKEGINSPNRKKFSTFLSSLSVELKAKDGKELRVLPAPSAGSQGTTAKIVEWHNDPQMPEAERLRKQFDGLDVSRGGSSVPQSQVPQGESVDPSEREIVANIMIQPKMYPVKLQVLNDLLIEMLGASEITQVESIHRIFNYAKVNNLFEVQDPQQNAAVAAARNGESAQYRQEHQQQQNQDQRKTVVIKADDLLYRIFGQNKLTLPKIMEMLSTKLLKPVEPIKIQYSINTLRNTTLGDVVIDLKVNPRLIDPKVKPAAATLSNITKMLTETVLNKQSLEDLARLNEGIRLNMQMLNYSKVKYDFYKKLSKDPAGFLRKVLKRNSEYLKILSSDSISFGANGMVDEEVVRRSDFYTDDFLRDHINLLLNGKRI